jgi:hypothetical protein
MSRITYFCCTRLTDFFSNRNRQIKKECLISFVINCTTLAQRHTMIEELISEALLRTVQSYKREKCRLP